MIKKISKKTHETLLEIAEHTFIPKKKSHMYVLMLAGAVLIFTGCILQVKYSIKKDIEALSYILQDFDQNFANRYTPADIVDKIAYTDSEGIQRGSLVVTGNGNNTGSCGYGAENPCSIYLNISERGNGSRLTEYLLLSRSFDLYSYKSIRLADSSTFEIVTEGSNGLCDSREIYTIKIINTSGVPVSKEVDNTCFDKQGEVISRESYATTTVGY